VLFRSDDAVDTRSKQNKTKRTRAEFIIANTILLQHKNNLKLPTNVKSDIEQLSARSKEGFYFKTIHTVKIVIKKIRD